MRGWKLFVNMKWYNVILNAIVFAQKIIKNVNYLINLIQKIYREDIKYSGGHKYWIKQGFFYNIVKNYNESFQDSIGNDLQRTIHNLQSRLVHNL